MAQDWCANESKYKEMRPCKCAIISKKVLAWLRSVIVFHSSCFSSKHTAFIKESVDILPVLVVSQPQSRACCWLYSSEIQTIAFSALKTNQSKKLFWLQLHRHNQ